LATGRDIAEKELVLSFDVDCGGWTIEGDKADIQESDARQAILDWIKENGPHAPKQIYEGMKEEGEQRSYAAVRGLLSKMTNDGTVINNNGIYLVAGVYQESTVSTPERSPADLPQASTEELDLF
jgi:hypothetical protein